MLYRGTQAIGSARESIEFPGNSPGKSQALGCKSTSVTSVVWLCCDITARVNAKSLEKYSKKNKA